MNHLRALARDFLALLRDGFRIWWLAPLVPLLVVVPEAIQHAAEIRIGMFTDAGTARTVADDPRRMVWGYLKIAGLVAAILAAARFWGAHARGERWWDLRRLGWGQFALGLIGVAVAVLPGWLLQPVIRERSAGWLDTILSLATLPAFTLLAAGLAGDRRLTPRRALTWGWLVALRMILFIVATWAPIAWLHGMNHRWAMGEAEPVVWSLMVFDSLVVGLLATMAGTAIHHGFAPPRRPIEEAPASGFTAI